MKSIKTGLIAFVFLFIFFGCKTDSAGNEEIDKNENTCIVIKGKIQNSGIGISGIVVTDGTNFTQTDENGNYSLSFNASATHVYISSPSGFLVANENSVPQFYARINSSTNINSVNFVLTKSDISEQKHFFIAIGDPQVRNEAEILKYKMILDYLKLDILKNKMNPTHLMIAGDIVFDTPNMHSQIKTSHSLVGLPAYYAIGNHDHLKNEKQSAADEYDKIASSAYLSHYGPTYYSFNRGQAHYVVIDDIFYRGGPETDYSINITQEQLSWVEKDLSYVPKDKLLIIMTHAPTKSRYKNFYGNCDKLHALLSGFKNVQIISGHTHYNAVVADDTEITEHIIGAACGGWWEGPVCIDGTYLGYKIFEIDGTSVKWKYRAYQFPNKQFSVFKPGERPFGLRPNEELLVNVWDWDNGWKVYFSEDNGISFREMDRYITRTYDPIAFQFFGMDGDNTIPIGRTWIDASTTDHIFTCIPEKNTKKLIVKVITRFNEEYSEEVDLY